MWSPEKQRFACEYCGSDYTEQQLAELAPSEQSNSSSETQEIAVYHCASCGAEVVTDATTAATTCYYCHNPVVLMGKLDGELRPHKVIPFTIGRDEAVSRFLSWVGKKWFVPPAFFCKKQIELISGVYFPYWITDVDVEAALDTTATKVRVWRAGNTEHTETSYFHVVREGNLHFEDIETIALRKANPKLVEGVQPFDGTAAQPFSVGYLSGFVAEKRDIEQAELTARVAQEVAGYTGHLVSDTVSGYSMVMDRTPTVTNRGDRWEYAMAPIWMLTYKGRDSKTYVFAMNGQTGRIYGELPLDIGRLALLFGGVALALLIILLIGGAVL